MKALMRSMKSFAYRAERIFGITMLMSLAFIFYFLFLDGTKFTMKHILAQAPFSILLMSVLMYMIYGLVDFVCYAPVSISCGCTRKNLVISYILMHALELGQTLLVLAVLFSVSPVKTSIEPGMFLKLCVTGVLISLAISLLTGVLVYRFGRIAYIIVIFVLAGGGGIIGGLVGAFGSSVVADRLPVLLQRFGLIGFAAVFYVICAVLFGVLIRKLEVKG